MKRFAGRLFVVLFLAMIVFASTPKVGDVAPTFSLPSASGATISLKDYAGRKVVLVFYRGYW
jgi:hypothetical protein